MNVIVHVGPRPKSMVETYDLVEVDDSAKVSKNPPNSRQRLLSTLNSYGRRLRELERRRVSSSTANTASLVEYSTSPMSADEIIAPAASVSALKIASDNSKRLDEFEKRLDALENKEA